MNSRGVFYFVLGLALTGLWAIAVPEMAVFKPGDTIKSSEVNGNFSSLRGAIEALEAPISTQRLADGSVTLPKLSIQGTVADGKVLKLQAGGLAWADDLLGGGGSSYTAGTGLNLSGTTFSLADGGVTSSKLATKLGADGQVLKLRGQNLVWANDISGAEGSYSADGSSLQLLGTTFSVRDSGIGTAKLGGGSVTSEKLRVPLRLISAGDGKPPLTISTPDVGLRVETRSDVSVNSQSLDGDAVRAVSNNGYGVYGTSISKVGIYGYSAGSDGIQGKSTTAAGVLGESANGSSVVGIGHSGYAAEFSGGRFGDGICYFAGGSGWSCTSDRNAKENFRPINPKDVLEAVAQLPITRWNMKGDASKTPHVGPVAQDFYSAFKVGNDDKTISTSDAQGVALAAIKGLYQENQTVKLQNQQLLQRLDRLEARLQQLEEGRSR